MSDQFAESDGSSPSLRLADRLAIEELNAAFAYHLDRNQVEPLLDLFTPDALYSNGPRVSRGRDEIEAFLRMRTANGPRTSRHIYSGLRILFDAADRQTAQGCAVWLSFARNGEPPIDDVQPFLIADFDDIYRRDPDGRWRIAQRRITPIFRNPGATPPGAPASARAPSS